MSLPFVPFCLGSAMFIIVLLPLLYYLVIWGFFFFYHAKWNHFNFMKIMQESSLISDIWVCSLVQISWVDLFSTMMLRYGCGHGYVNWGYDSAFLEI